MRRSGYYLLFLSLGVLVFFLACSDSAKWSPVSPAAPQARSNVVHTSTDDTDNAEENSHWKWMAHDNKYDYDPANLRGLSNMPQIQDVARIIEDCLKMF